MINELIGEALAFYDEMSSVKNLSTLKEVADKLDEEWNDNHSAMSVKDFVMLAFRDDVIYMLRNEGLDRTMVYSVLEEAVERFAKETEIEEIEIYEEAHKTHQGGALFWTKCVHKQTQIDGIWPGLLTASGSLSYDLTHTKIEHPKVTPDFGLYADHSWVKFALCRNEFINWPDMSTPVDAALSFEQISSAYQYLQTGLHVDVGCAGAHGRTGTIIAALKLLETPSLEVSEVVELVRSNYCTKAIETSSQVEYLAKFKEMAK